MRRAWPWAIFGCVVLAGGAWLARVRSSEPAPRTDVAIRRDRGRELLVRPGIPEVPLATPGDVERWIEGVADSGRPPGAPGDRLRRELEASLASMLEHRWIAPDASAYARWRRETGCVPTPDEEMERLWARTAAIEEATRATDTKPTSWDEQFAAVFDHAPALGNGSCVPRALCDGFGQIAFGRLTAANPSRPVLEGELGDAVHFGGLVSRTRGWWSHPRPVRERLAKGEGVLVAVVGALVVFEPDSLRRPVLFNFVYDDPSGRWWLEGLVVAQWPADRAFAWEH